MPLGFRVYPNRWAKSFVLSCSFSLKSGLTSNLQALICKDCASVHYFSSTPVKKETVHNEDASGKTLSFNEGCEGNNHRHLNRVAEAKADRLHIVGHLGDFVARGRQERPRSCVMSESVVNLKCLSSEKRQDPSSDMQMKIQLLQSEQCSPSFVASLVEKRAFKSCCFEQLAAVLQVLRRSSLGGRTHEVLLRRSAVLCRPVESWQKTLNVLDKFNVKEDVHPYFLILDAPLLERKLTFYADFGMTSGVMKRMLQSYQSVLRSSIENSVMPSLKFFESKGLTREQTMKLLLSYPHAFSSKGACKPRRLYNNSQEVGFAASAFYRVVRDFMRGPSDKLLLQKQAIKDLGFSDDDIQTMIRRVPTLLAVRPECLKEKFHYLVHEQRRTMAEIVKFPKCLLFSLDSRLIPRFNLGHAKVYSLYALLSPSNARFHERFGKYVVS